MSHRAVVLAVTLLSGCTGTAGNDETCSCDEGQTCPSTCSDTCEDHDGDGYVTGAGCTPLDCDDDDDQVWQMLSGYIDHDGDDHLGEDPIDVCSGASLPAEYTTAPDDEPDCDDDDDDVWRSGGYMDHDRDGYTEASTGPWCDERTQPEPSAIIDCDDLHANVWQLLPGYADSDLDDYSKATLISVCSGDSLPASYLPAATSTIDCDDDDPDNWLSCGSCVDTDGDGAFIGCDAYIERTGPDACPSDEYLLTTACGACVDTDGDTYFSGCDRYDADRPGPDCMPGEIDIHPNAVDVRFDGVDWDCDGADLAMDAQHAVYVSTSGNDGNPGTQAAPFLTVGAALNAAQGRNVIVGEGTYDAYYSFGLEARLYCGFSSSWTYDPDNHPTTLTSGNAATLTLFGGGVIQGCDIANTNYAAATLYGDGMSYLVVDSSFSSTGGGGGYTVALGLSGTLVATLENDTFVGLAAATAAVNTATAISVFDGTTLYGTGLTIDGADFAAQHVYGIDSNGGSSPYVELSSSTITAGPASIDAAAVRIFFGTMLADHVTFDGVGGATTTQASGIQALSSVLGDYVKVFNCEVHSGQATSYAAGVDLHQPAYVANSTIEAASTGTLTRGAIVAGAVQFVNDDIAVLSAGTDNRGVTVDTNTVELVNTLVRVSGGTATNHAVFATVAGHLYMSHNDLWASGTGSDLVYLHDVAVSITSNTNVDACATNYAAHCTLSTGTLAVDPLLDVDGKHLQSGSPCVGAGTDPVPLAQPGWYTDTFLDIDDQTRPISTWDIGVDER